MKPKVSLLMPVFNQERFVKKAIKSILNQTFTDFEFLIIDDSSNDSTLKILKSFKDKKIKVFKNIKQLGLAKCLNFLIKKAKGKYIVRMDGDDISAKDRLKVQVELLDKNPQIALVGSWAEVIDANGNIIGQFKHPTKYSKIRDVILSYNPFIHPSVCFRKKIFNSIGGYNEELFYSQDYDLFLRMVEKYKSVNLPRFLLKFRWLPNYRKQKEQHLTALKIRLKAISQYNYKKWEIIKLAKPVFNYLMPVSLKRLYWDIKFKKIK